VRIETGEHPFQCVLGEFIWPDRMDVVALDGLHDRRDEFEIGWGRRTGSGDQRDRGETGCSDADGDQTRISHELTLSL
jgi:hypothetical protein